MAGLTWTLAELICEDMTVTAYCQSAGCHHKQAIDLRRLAEKFGPDARAMASDLRPWLRCSKCGGKDVGLIYSPATKPGGANR